MTVDPASYRDPSGHVHIEGERIFRTVTPHGRKEYEFIRDSGALNELIERGLLVGATEVERSVLVNANLEDLILEHPKIPILSYPYEWSFRALKAAALLHLDIQLDVLKNNFVLSDASAFNIQFLGGKPIFIDYLSFRRYQEGEPWLGHRQFCEQFLNPLILQAKLGAPFHAAYRGRPDGIESTSLSPLLKLRHKWSLTVFSHVTLLARSQNRVDTSMLKEAQAAQVRGLKRGRYRAILLQLRQFISHLKPAEGAKTTWETYANDNTYETVEAAAKRAVVELFVTDSQPNLLIDLGCNTGDYSQLALSCGAKYVVGLDSDHGAIERAFMRSVDNDLNFLPLIQDLGNPTPGLGWNGRERQSMSSRLAQADGVLALALVHHLAIARNIPLDEVVNAIVAMAPRGVIEFVPKNDPTVQIMLALREDIFVSYNRETFIDALERRATVIAHKTVSESGRELFCFRRD